LIATRAQRSTDARTRRPETVAAACLLGLLGLAVGTARAESGETAVQATTAETSASSAQPATTATTPSAEAAATSPPGRSVRIIEARVRPAKAYFYGLKKIRFAIKLAAKAPTDLRIDIVRRSGRLERSIVRLDVPPKRRTVIPWDGLSTAGAPVRGKLRFLVRGVNGEPIVIARRYAAKRKKGPKMRFGLFDHIFPVRGKHSYGDGIGAPRAGHTHQGQDISAKCGTRLVAAQGGTVQVAAYQAGGAGYYVVIDTIGSDVDHVYMHMIGPLGVVPGQVVYTGQGFGQVGSTGRSSGCHLHFEMWSPPGWYEGGSFWDPAPYLRAWDRYS